MARIKCKYRIYKCDNPPIKGSSNFYDVPSQTDAIILSEKLRKKTHSNKWVWAKIR